MQTSLQFEGAFSVGASSRAEWWKMENHSVPGPQFNYKQPIFVGKPKSPLFSFPKGNRAKLYDDRGFPAPTRYGQKHEFDTIGKDPDFKKISFPKRGMEDQKIRQENSVNPQSYQPRDKLSKKSQPTFSFGYKFEDQIQERSPGPHVYPREDIEDFKMSRTSEQWRKAKSSSFGTSSKMKLRDTGIPGPGQYNPNFVNTKTYPKYSINRPQTDEASKNRVDSVNEGTPGPGRYDPKFIPSKSNGFSCGAKFNPKQTNLFVPGPGAYDQTLPSQVHQIRIGTAPRGDLVDKEALSKPSPWKYTPVIPNYNIHEKKVSTMGTSQRPPLSQTEDVPGSGTYFQELKSDAPQFSMAAKLKEQKPQSLFFPGTGTYDPSYDYSQTKAPEFGIGKSMRSDPVKSKFTKVGPGSYDIAKELKGGQKFSIGGEKRFKHKKGNYEPGPGSYDLGTTIGKIPQYHFLSKTKNPGMLDIQ